MRKSAIDTTSQATLARSLLQLPRPVKRLVALTVDGLMCIFATWAALSLRLETWVGFTP